jgi:hypothetical protein
VLLELDGEPIDGARTAGTIPPALAGELYRPENIAQLILLVNYCKFNDAFMPLLTRFAVKNYVDRHPESAVPRLPFYEVGVGGEKTLNYFAEANVRGGQLYFISCRCPIAEGSPCDAVPA